MQCALLHPAGVYDIVQVEGTLGPALPQVPRHLTQLGAGLTLVLITVTEAETLEICFFPHSFLCSFFEIIRGSIIIP